MISQDKQPQLHSILKLSSGLQQQVNYLKNISIENVLKNQMSVLFKFNLMPKEPGHLKLHGEQIIVSLNGRKLN